jgi:hypothetical protein
MSIMSKVQTANLSRLNDLETLRYRNCLSYHRMIMADI